MNYVYILRCADDTFYCGWTNDLTARLAAHNSGTGAKYTRGRGPLQLVYSEVLPTKSDALRREAQIKRLPRAAKEALLATQTDGELLTVLDADGRDCGVRPRALVHAQGLRHRVAHLWIAGSLRGAYGLWLQQRAASKALYPLCFDLASTGHIDPGETPETGVVRETREEIGLLLSPEALTPLGVFTQQYDRGEDGGFDDEVVHSFLFRQDGIPPFVLGEEVEQMVFVPLDGFAATVAHADALPAQTAGGKTFSIPSERLCCLHKKEWASAQQALANE